MAAITLDSTAEHIKPLEGATVRRCTAGGTITAGQPVSMNSSGTVVRTNTSTAATQYVVGIALQSVVSGNTLDVVTFGPVICTTVATPAALAYGSDTAGALDDAVGTQDVVVGFSESATVLFVRPQFIDYT